MEISNKQQFIEQTQQAFDELLTCIEWVPVRKRKLSVETKEIFTKKYYKWTKTSNLYSYFAANTLHHYVWALKKCRKISTLLMQVEETVK